ncbi:MAG: YeeE/YedE family protein [Pirellulales bacterium]|nr:YeeE/YedE family protein [Pirellulales bacterium]
MNWLRQPRWSPYLVGAGIGVLSWITFGLMGKALGTSTTLVRWAGLLEALVDRQHVTANAYYAKYLVSEPAVDWQMMLVVGLPIGALISALLSRSYRVERVPKLWEWRFGPSRAKRYAWAFLGGALLLFGARLAGGCTSGHGISGGLQLSVGSWLFFAAFFSTGVIAAFVLFGKEGRNHV